MAEHGTMDARFNKKRLSNTSHELPADHVIKPDPRHNTSKAKLVALAAAEPKASDKKPVKAPTRASLKDSDKKPEAPKQTSKPTTSKSETKK